jgi:hypothetical protein
MSYFKIPNSPKRQQQHHNIKTNDKMVVVQA